MAITKKTKLSRDIDPTTFSVVWNKFDYIVEQIGQKILYSTQSFVTALVRDLGQTLLDTKGQIVSAATFLPVHTTVAEETIKGLESYFHGDYEPGDYIIANDPYIIKGGHLPDWNFVRPAFYKDELVGFLQAKTHVSDTGGFYPGGYSPGAYDIIAEGLNIPPLKVIKAGVLQKEVWGFLLRNVRNPTQVDMDTMLINGCLTYGEQQLVGLIEKYGLKTIKDCMAEIVDAGERAMRAEIEKIPDGTYYAESAADWDGKTDKMVWVRAKVTIKGDEAVVDLSESDDQATFINVPGGQTICQVVCAFYFMIDPGVPKSGGTMRPIHIVMRPGSVVNPVYPATIGGGQVSVCTQIMEAVTLALGKAMPERAMAGWCRHLCPINIGMDPRVIDPRTNHIKQYFSETFASDAGSGAVKGYDGWQGIHGQGPAGNFMRPNMEHFELSVPYRCTRYEILPDWEGAGEFRGSPGTYTENYVDTAEGAPSFLMTGNSDGMFFPAPGVEGGGSGPGAQMWIIGKDDKKRVLRTCSMEPVYPGEKWITMSPGGGGYGNPLNRDAQRVQDDVMDGLISVQRARDVYGVMIHPDTFEVDYEATEKLRAEMHGKKKK